MLTPKERKRILGEEPEPLSYRIQINHHPDCPLGENGLNAYHEARIVLASTPPEARSTLEDQIAFFNAEFELEQIQVCKCGASAAQIAQLKST